MFERFTERARQVVVLAQDESRALGHDYIGTEHILLGLLREEEGLAARALESLDVTVEEVRARVVGTVGMGERAATGQIPFTPPAKEALEASLREAMSLGHNFIGTEHVLLGLVRNENDVAVRVLRELRVDPGRIRDELMRMLSGRPAEPKDGPSSAETARARTRVTFPPAFFAGWLSFGAALAVGVLVGWLIWG